MPSGKSRSSDTQPDSASRRTSLRRLSSIASFHTLNRFARRRSNNATDSPSNASNASASSTAAPAPERRREHSPSRTVARHVGGGVDVVPPLPSDGPPPSRRNSYMCLPDDPIGGMPRSRTLSNLPLPSRMRKTAALQQSTSHARFPSSSRIPTPTASSTRKDSTSRLPSLELDPEQQQHHQQQYQPHHHHHRHHQQQPHPARKSLVRSDTEPLLQHALAPRSTAFKENISLSPIKPLPSMLEDDRFGFANSSGSTVSRHGWSDSSDAAEPLLGTRKSSLPVWQQPRRLSQKFNSSPAYRPSRERAPTPGKPVERWNSQPILTNKTSTRPSHGEIKQTRLMSERGPPTPRPAKSSSSRDFSGDDMKRMSTHSSHLRGTSELAPLGIEQRLRSDPTRPRAESLQAKPGAITTAQPLAYWTGRFSALNDRYRNEDWAASFPPPQHSSATDTCIPGHAKSSTNRMHTSEANATRMRRAIEHLFSLCATDQARQSFLVWQKAVASALGIPDLGRPVKGSEAFRRGWNLEMSLRSTSMANLTASGSHVPGGEPRKFTNFVDRLLGRRQKSEALLAGG